MTTNPLLARAREALANITPGEWVYDEYNSLLYAGGQFIADVRTHAYDCADNDGRFIASAPPLVRDLVALAEQQAAEIERLVEHAAEQENAVKDELIRLQAQIKMHQHNAEVRAEQYRQAYHNYILVAQQLSRHAPDALAAIKSQLYDSVNEPDKVMLIAQAEQEATARARRLLGLEE